MLVPVTHLDVLEVAEYRLCVGVECNEHSLLSPC
jgi:hypothetical protein